MCNATKVAKKAREKWKQSITIRGKLVRSHQGGFLEFCLCDPTQ